MRMTRNELMKVGTAQVRFFNENSEGYLSGILHNGEVICGCCGGVIPIDEVFESYDLAVAEKPSRSATGPISFDRASIIPASARLNIMSAASLAF